MIISFLFVHTVSMTSKIFLIYSTIVCVFVFILRDIAAMGTIFGDFEEQSTWRRLSIGRRRRTFVPVWASDPASWSISEASWSVLVRDLLWTLQSLPRPTFVVSVSSSRTLFLQLFQDFVLSTRVLTLNLHCSIAMWKVGVQKKTATHISSSPCWTAAVIR
jgi:hypothetical protein